jgi:hypothetical protein
MTTSPTSVMDPSGAFQALPSDNNWDVLGLGVLVFGDCQMPSRTCDRDILGCKGCPLHVSSTCIGIHSVKMPWNSVFFFFFLH